MTTILIADDSRMIRNFVREALATDYQIVEAVDGADALVRAASVSADLVITDVNMPELDGIGLVRALRARPAYGATPILVLTTEHSDAMKAAGREAGANGWLVKPFDGLRLRQVVAYLLRRSPR